MKTLKELQTEEKMLNEQITEAKKYYISNKDELQRKLFKNTEEQMILLDEEKHRGI